MNLILVTLLLLGTSGLNAMDFAREIGNSRVLEMPLLDQHAYLFVKGTCGYFAGVRMGAATLETFKDAAVAGLTFNFDYLELLDKAAFSPEKIVNSRKAIIISQSPGTKEALEECYGANASRKKDYVDTVLHTDEQAVLIGGVVGVVGGFIGGGLIVSGIKKFGWIPLMNILRSRGMTPRQIKILLGSILGVAAGGIAYKVVSSDEDDKYNPKGCTEEVATAEDLYKKSLKESQTVYDSHWRRAAISDREGLLEVLRRCIDSSHGSERKQYENKYFEYVK